MDECTLLVLYCRHHDDVQRKKISANKIYLISSVILIFSHDQRESDSWTQPNEKRRPSPSPCDVSIRGWPPDREQRHNPVRLRTAALTRPQPRDQSRVDNPSLHTNKWTWAKDSAHGSTIPQLLSTMDPPPKKRRTKSLTYFRYDPLYSSSHRKV